MNKRSLFILGLLTIVVALGVVVVHTKKPTSPTEHNTTEIKKIKPLPKMAVVTLSKDGFSPKTVTIAVGSAIRWKNISGSQQTVNSDTYPTNQLHRELNFGLFNSGSSVTYTFMKPGTYGYHNQLNPKQKGEIIVK